MNLYRWLIDVDRDAEGLRVLVDLHGGHDDDPIAIAEYNEIRNKVHEEVSAIQVTRPIFLTHFLA